ncbi:MAG: DNA translocase FtsK [Candidatus Babeliales bacterium]
MNWLTASSVPSLLIRYRRKGLYVLLALGVVGAVYSLILFQGLFLKHSGWLFWCEASILLPFGSWLFFVLGGASWLTIAVAMFFAAFASGYFSWKNEWDRLLCSLGLIPLWAGLLAYYGVDFYASSIPGGVIGQAVCYYLIDWAGLFLAPCILTVGLIAHGIMVIGLALPIRLMRYIHYGFLYCLNTLKCMHIVWLLIIRVLRVLFFALRSITTLFWKMVTERPAEVGWMLEKEANERKVTSHLYQEGLWKKLLTRKERKNRTKENQKIVDVYASVEEEVAPDTDFSTDTFTSAHKDTGARKEKMHRKNVSTELLQNNCYQFPDKSVFQESTVIDEADASIAKELEERSSLLEEKLERFGVSGSVVSIKRGPVVTLFEYKPDIDSKISKIIALEDDLALALQALSIRIIAPIPGRAVVGFEVSNKQRSDVLFSSFIGSLIPDECNKGLFLVLGSNTIGDQVIIDLVKSPHLLVAGSTGSGKSVALNTMLVSLLCTLSPDELRLILIDPKRLEFAVYADIPHLLFPIVVDVKKVAPILGWVVREMEERYEKMACEGVRNIDAYNERVTSQEELMPRIVVVIDELADLMMTTGREVEDLITRIAQMARAAGIHMIVATQRPSVDVITGIIKVNFPSRISFRVSSKVDSRTILDTCGAEKLLGRGDMLYLDAGHARLIRVHGAYLSDKEIYQVVDFIKQQRQPDYLDPSVLVEMVERFGATDDYDVLYEDVLRFLEEVEEVSISLLQRKFRIGYNRSARIIEMLESEGIIVPGGSGKMRKVLYPKDGAERME